MRSWALSACGKTALNILGSLAGGLAGKLAAKYALPWKWKKAYELGKAVWKHAGDAISAFKNWLAAKDKLKIAGRARENARKALAAVCGRNSFASGTAVVMADGTEKQIEQVEVGDKVLAADPATGKVEAKPVVDTITGEGAKNLVQVTVDVDGENGNAEGVIVATDEHPFWVETLQDWVAATRLEPGSLLRTANGASVKVVGLAKWTTSRQRVYNLTIADNHTYHVAASGVGVLVHNIDIDPGCYGFSEDDAKSLGNWYNTTFSDKDGALYGSVRYHLDKDGKGRTLADYTREAKSLWARTPKKEREKVQLDNGEEGWRIKVGKTFGIYTKSGKIVTYAD